MRRLPAMALLLGLAGLIPFVACGLMATTTLDIVGANYWLLALCGYGAVILSFVGAVHWGFVLDAGTSAQPAPQPPRLTYRLILGVLPSLGGWAAILVMFTGQTVIALAILIAGFVTFVSAETELSQRGLLPPGYIVMRWALSLVVVAVLGFVLVLRVFGWHINI